MTDATKTVRDIVQTQPSSLVIFEQFGIEYCCCNSKSLGEVCATNDLDVEIVIAALDVASRHEDPSNDDWMADSLTRLTLHIIRTHHGYCKGELPLLLGLVAKVVKRHGGANPELQMIQSKLTLLADMLTCHLAEEESIVFPMIAKLEAEEAGAGVQDAELKTNIGNLCVLLMAEHDIAGNLLAELRNLSHNFVAPGNACATHQALFDGLRELERDLHRHVHLENNILFPRAIAIASSPSAS